MLNMRKFLEFAKFITNQKINIIFAVVGQIDKPKIWGRKNIDNFVEIYLKSDLKKNYKKKKKKLYSQNKKNIVGVTIKPEFPKKADIIVNNNFSKSLDNISKYLLKKKYLKKLSYNYMKIVVLLAAMTRGGIDLFQSLLDNHSEILQLPGKFYIDEFLKKIKNKKVNSEIAQEFINCYQEYFDSRLNIVERHNFLGQNKDEFYFIDKDKFIKKFDELSKNKKLNKKEIIINLHLAYSSASEESIDKKKLIILQIHHLFRIKSIEDLDFDIACTIRDPIASHSSYVKNLSKFNNKFINPWQYYYHMERNFSHLIELFKLKKKN